MSKLSKKIIAAMGLPDADELMAESKHRIEMETKAEGDDQNER
jgi:hypothetical protein